MSRRIRITAGGISLLAELNDTQTAQKIWDALPIREPGNRWGEEIYFGIPVRMETEKGQAVVNLGDLGYWAPGNAFCIFFGPTPASQTDEIRPASPVTVFGKVIGDAKIFKTAAAGTRIAIRSWE